MILSDRLNRLMTKNENPGNTKIFPQKISPPDGYGWHYNILGGKMKHGGLLRERYNFCSDWLNLYCGQTLLAPKRTGDAWNNLRWRQQINNRYQYWNKSFIANTIRVSVVLLAIDETENDETYACYNEGPEPVIVSYVGYDERVYGNFLIFIEALLKA